MGEDILYNTGYNINILRPNPWHCTLLRV